MLLDKNKLIDFNKFPLFLCQFSCMFLTKVWNTTSKKKQFVQKDSNISHSTTTIFLTELKDSKISSL